MVSSNTILKILRVGESERMEFKESFGREALETLCAFANTKGGTLLIGADDKGRVVGLSIGQHTLRDLSNQIVQGTGLQPSIKRIRVQDKDVVLIQVDESRIKPVMFHCRAYRRVGSTTRQMGVEELTRLILESAGTTWDELQEPRAKWSDVDSAKMKTFVRLANEVGRRPIPESISARQLLEKLDLVRKGKLTRASVLLFGKQPQKFYPQAVFKAGRFKSETLIVDDREMENTLFDQVDGAMNYFRERLQTRFEMTGKPPTEWPFSGDAQKRTSLDPKKQADCQNLFLCRFDRAVGRRDGKDDSSNQGRRIAGAQI